MCGYTVPRFGLVLIVVIGLFGGSVGLAGKDCDPVEGTGLTHAIAENRFAGSAGLILDERPMSAWVTVTLLEQRITEDGTIHATTAHVFELDGDADGECDDGENCYETLDHAVLDPSHEIPGLFRMNETNRIIGGTGTFAEACGKTATHGWMDFLATPPTADWSVKGRVCYCR